MDRVTGSVVGRFPAPSGAGGALSISLDPGIYNDSDVHLLLHPVRAAAYVVLGDLIVGDPKSIEVPSGALQFGGGRTAALPLMPVGGAPEFRLLGPAFDAAGQPASIGLRFDAATCTLTASRECHAAVAYTRYTSLSKRLRYRPATRMIPGGGLQADFGSIAGVLRGPLGTPPAILVYPVQPFNVFNGVAMYELYKITSATVTNNDAQGEHERPPAYPANGNYPGKDPIEISPSLQTKRVHEIGYMDEGGRGYVNSYYVSPLHPYVGDNEYVIPKAAEIADVAGFPRHLQQKALDFIASRNLGPERV